MTTEEKINVARTAINGLGSWVAATQDSDRAVTREEMGLVVEDVAGALALLADIAEANTCGITAIGQHPALV